MSAPTERVGPLPAGFQDAAAAEIAVETDVALTCGPSGRSGDRDGCIGAAKRLPLSSQRRIGLIGGDQRVAQRIGRGGPGHQRSNQRSGNKLSKHCECPLKGEIFRAC